jgi:hypothetical protein
MLLGVIVPVPFSAGSASQSEHTTTEHRGENPEHLIAAIARADKMMSGMRRVELETPHFHIATDVFAMDVLRELGGSLEGTYYAIDQVLDLAVDDVDRKVRVYFFEHSTQHYRLAGFTRGIYVSPGLLAFYRGDSDTGELLEVLIHETTHAFVDQFIFAGDIHAPRWLNEGFATYMGYSAVVDDRIKPGLYYDRHKQVFLNTTRIQRSRAFDAAKRINRRIKHGPMIAIERLIVAGPLEFRSSAARDYYDLAWAFVHYLRHGIEDGHKKFSRLMAAFAAGADADAAFNEVYSQTPAEMERSLHEYVRNVLIKPPRAPKKLLRM